MYVDQILGKCRDGANCRDHLPGLTKTQSHQDTLCRYNNKILGSRSNLDVNEIEADSMEIIFYKISTIEESQFFSKYTRKKELKGT